MGDSVHPVRTSRQLLGDLSKSLNEGMVVESRNIVERFRFVPGKGVKSLIFCFRLDSHSLSSTQVRGRKDWYLVLLSQDDLCELGLNYP